MLVWVAEASNLLWMISHLALSPSPHPYGSSAPACWG
jgi:hypothetical protein